MEVSSIFTITVEEIVCVWTGPCQVQTERSWATDPGTAFDTNGENAQTNASTLTSVSRRVCEQIRDKAVLLPLRSIFCLRHRDLVYM
jgi:hypothetical protein